MTREPNEQPFCRTCFKLLPWSWRDFDTCPMCMYQARVKAASRIHCRMPSYRSPLLALDRELNG